MASEDAIGLPGKILNFEPCYLKIQVSCVGSVSISNFLTLEFYRLFSGIIEVQMCR